MNGLSTIGFQPGPKRHLLELPVVDHTDAGGIRGVPCKKDEMPKARSLARRIDQAKSSEIFDPLTNVP